jgi:phosphoribosylformylglycinamidine synthase
LFVTLCESAFVNQLVFSIETDDEIRKDNFLYGESQSRVVVNIKPEKQEAFIELLSTSEVTFGLLGEVIASQIVVDDEDWGNINHFLKPYDSSLANWMEK